MRVPRILWRYIVRDVLLHTLLGLLIFTLLLVVQNMLRFLEELLGAGVTAGDLLQLMLIVLPSYLAYAIPTALLFGVLLTFGRMSADGEIIAMRASGLSVPRVLPPVLLIGACATLITAYVSFEVEPRSHLAMKRLVRHLARAVELVRPGEFRTIGQRLVYVREAGDEACPLAGVLIADKAVQRRSLYITARCGSVESAEQATLSLRLHDGSIHFDEPEGESYRRLRFDEMRTDLDLSFYLDRGRRARDYTYLELLELRKLYQRGEGPALRGGDSESQVDVQLHRRAAFALASLVLATLALPLGIRPLRSGRSWGALIATGVMALYWGLFSVGELMTESSWVPVWLGLWTPNVLVLMLGALMIRHTMHTDA